MNFPDSPSNGDTYTAPSGENFIYNTAKGRWASQPNSLLTVPSSIIPDTDSAYDLGSPTKKFKSLYLSSSTLYLGDSSSISAGDSGEIVLPAIKIGTGHNAVKLSAGDSGDLVLPAIKIGHGDNTIKLQVDNTGKLKKESTKGGVKQPEIADVENISDLQDVDITSSAPTDGQTLLWDSANSKFIPGDGGGGTALVGITSIDSVSTYAVLDALYDREYSLTSNASTIGEGDSVTFTLTTKYVPSNTVFGYVTTGITSADLDSGSAGLTGNFVMSDTGVDWQKSGTVSYILKNDLTVEGTETIQFDVSNIPSPNTQSLQVTVNDTSTPSITRVSYEPDWSTTTSTSSVGCQVITTSGKAGDGTYSWWNTTHGLDGDDIIWIYLIGGGGQGNTHLQPSASANNSWRFGGAGGNAMLIVTTVYDAFSTQGEFFIGSGDNTSTQSWRGTNGSHSRLITADGSNFNVSTNFGMVVHNPRNQMKQNAPFNGTNWNWPININGISAPTATNFAVGSDAQVWGTVPGEDTGSGTGSYPQNVTWGGGRGTGTSTGTTQYQGTSRYAGDGGTLGYDNAQIPGGGGSSAITLSVEGSGGSPGHKPGKRGEARIYWKI